MKRTLKIINEALYRQLKFRKCSSITERNESNTSCEDVPPWRSLTRETILVDWRR